LEDQRGWFDHVRKWWPRLAVGLLFFFVGKSKLGARSGWIKTFERIGFGQWFRYLTGAIQMVGAIAVLIPRIFLCGILPPRRYDVGSDGSLGILPGCSIQRYFPGGTFSRTTSRWWGGADQFGSESPRGKAVLTKMPQTGVSSFAVPVVSPELESHD